MTGHVLIIGGGQAAFQTAASLRAKSYDGAITIVSDDAVPPYQLPPLSKGYVKGSVSEEDLAFRKPEFYPDSHITLRLNTRAIAIDRAAKQVILAGRETLAYDTLVLATGARVRPLPLPGADLDGLLYLRTLADARLLKERVYAAQSVAVIGGGFIGLEAAAVAAQLGKKVTVIEALDRLMARAVAPEISEAYAKLHRSRAVDVRLATKTAGIAGEEGRAVAVILADGSAVEADLIIAGIGVLPNQEIAHEAGLICGNGIEVDNLLRTCDPAIFAIGDCASFPTPFAEGRVRLESVQNALDQARFVADTVMGEGKPYDAVPWFWSDQFEAKLQIAGLSMGHDQRVLRGDPAAGGFSVFYFKAGKMIAADSLDKSGDHVAVRRMLALGSKITAAQAGDESVSLKALLKA